MTPNQVLSSKNAKEAATRFAEWLRAQVLEIGYSTKQIFLWSPQETQERGWGSGWSVCWEEGPFEWTSITGGSTLYAGETGSYSTPGPFPQGLSTHDWMAECYNSFVLNFHDQ